MTDDQEPTTGPDPNSYDSLFKAAHAPTSPPRSVRAASSDARPAETGNGIRGSEGSPSPEPVLTAENVTVRYGGVVAVSDVSISARRGEVVGLIGPNGAGKTSLFDAISGFARMQAGSVRLGGVRLDGKPPHSRAALGLRRTFQGSELFDDLSVADNIGVTAASKETADAVMQHLGLESWAGVNAINVPTGLRRRVDLGRALAANPSVVLLDEPGAGLGPQDKEELAVLLRQLAANEQIAFLLVDHDVDLVSRACDRAYVLALGALISEGDMDHVTHDPAVVGAYLGATLALDEDAPKN